ncbi:unnamed protein product [Caenorhabditis bovis]|uniref:Uncharacterized protein n=1 Tax=Caenorhabditis bovis TaxID=2654633 RepID=A0A8S1E7K9_9PELO|nr:unnamed protein product [Caenorhabditis bovis]
MSAHTFTVNSTDYVAACYSNGFQVPKNSKENRNLKYGHVEDDNVDIAYLNFPLLRASCLFTIISLTSFFAAIYAAFRTDYKPFTDEELLDNSLIIFYGSKPFRCRTHLKFPKDGLPSILNLFELNVWANVIFRLSACLTVAVRVFHVFILKKLVINTWSNYPNPVLRWFCDLMPMLSFIESTAMALFSIITMHNDFKDVNHFAKSVFAVSGTVNMFLIAVLSFMATVNSPKILNAITVIIRLACAFVFAYTAPQYFEFHIGWTKECLCHSYIPRDFAFLEYSLIFAYLIFYLTCLDDLKHLQFICYPRTSSGECEPLDPANFEVGAKYEHCRAYEFNQRRINAISDNIQRM